eukprot:CAMPEP_0197254272 /NCGR_PEP_ID=MMETSP1429-20130617/68039_1 /TAXON_ID=49237 /ORGANISM="Chaetoceros  sp., Strain UNC1202" /LENGTH=313 /DNA_ID=CAMNT_0042717213 /DNA_START=54 /DNA_END=995 /DNA_ORIENTATION=-
MDCGSHQSGEKRKVSEGFIRRNKIVLLGDSITQMSFSAALSGWGAHLADIYQRRCDVFNRGMSGYNTDWYLRYLETDQGRYDVFDSMTVNGGVNDDGVSDVKLVTIFFGANDASCSKLNPRHHVSIPQFKKNLQKLVSLCRKHYGRKVRIILITPPPVHHDSRLKYQIERYGNKATGKLERTLDLSSEYAAAVEAVATDFLLPCLNVWQLMQDTMPGEGEKWSEYLSDGLHLSSEGNIFLGESLKEMVHEVYPEIAVTACPHTGYTGNSSSKGGLALGSERGVGPWHDQIDHLQAEKSFEATSGTSCPKKRSL